ncbi:MAG: phosphate ABC transporter permease PstA [Bdellovibrionales bacterium]|nr:phosphate ABC transporter permease PstA [Bdellovibrionales bacterium]
MGLQATSFQDRKRKAINIAALGAVLGLAFLAAVPFVLVSGYILVKGIGSVDWAFFTELPKGPGETGGGMANAMAGTGVLVTMACLLGIPWGMATGIYLSEYGHGKTASILRFTVDLLTSVPSIIVGIFVYGLIVVHIGYSSYAGAAALAIIMLPIVARSTEEIMKLIPNSVREAGLALGLPRWKVILRILVPGCMGGLVTGFMLAIARVAGETAPLLFTAFGNQFYSTSLDQPIASLPVQIYNFAKSGFPDLVRQSWAGALVLVGLVFFLNFGTRSLLYLKNRKEIKS